MMYKEIFGELKKVSTTYSKLKFDAKTKSLDSFFVFDILNSSDLVNDNLYGYERNDYSLYIYTKKDNDFLYDLYNECMDVFRNLDLKFLKITDVKTTPLSISSEYDEYKIGTIGVSVLEEI